MKQKQLHMNIPVLARFNKCPNINKYNISSSISNISQILIGLTRFVTKVMVL